jgi:transposase
MVAQPADLVIGVDTHRDTHALALVGAHSGQVIAEFQVRADPAGYRSALDQVERHPYAGRIWAIEGCGSYGAGLCRYLAGAGEHVVEAGRPTPGVRPKSDALDAVRAARSVLSHARPALPRAGGPREILRVLMLARDGAIDIRRTALCQLRALIVSAPDGLREPLRDLTRGALLRRCAALRPGAHSDPVMGASALALSVLGRRILAASAEARELERAIHAQIARIAPALLEEFGVGPINAARLLLSWSHPGRIHSEAAFARLGGVAPIPASSGQVVRHRLNRGGDRQLNRALHAIILVRKRADPATRAYIARRLSEGKSTRDATRCLKRFLARHLFRVLEATVTSA